MHKTYAAYFSAVEIDFALNVRGSPYPLQQIRNEVRTFPANNAYGFGKHVCKSVRLYSGGISIKTADKAVLCSEQSCMRSW